MSSLLRATTLTRRFSITPLPFLNFPTQADCQLYHVCSPVGDGVFTKFDFLCPNGTIFNQVSVLTHPSSSFARQSSSATGGSMLTAAKRTSSTTWTLRWRRRMLSGRLRGRRLGKGGKRERGSSWRRSRLRASGMEEMFQHPLEKLQSSRSSRQAPTEGQSQEEGFKANRGAETSRLAKASQEGKDWVSKSHQAQKEDKRVSLQPNNTKAVLAVFLSHQSLHWKSQSSCQLVQNQQQKAFQPQQDNPRLSGSKISSKQHRNRVVNTQTPERERNRSQLVDLSQKAQPSPDQDQQRKLETVFLCQRTNH